eukprot:GEMP01115888.1.p1 GENE.GEMP01115888.1~~GEMP01115888.1.p1  ORF type:complete len:166 (+),score=28.78 GEMP01115888.1:79-576(+)
MLGNANARARWAAAGTFVEQRGIKQRAFNRKTNAQMTPEMGVQEVLDEITRLTRLHPGDIQRIRDALTPLMYRIASDGSTRVDIMEDVLFLMEQIDAGVAQARGALHVLVARAMGCGAAWIDEAANAPHRAPFANMEAALQWLGTQGVHYSGVKSKALKEWLKNP